MEPFSKLNPLIRVERRVSVLFYPRQSSQMLHPEVFIKKGPLGFKKKTAISNLKAWSQSIDKKISKLSIGEISCFTN